MTTAGDIGAVNDDDNDNVGGGGVNETIGSSDNGSDNISDGTRVIGADASSGTPAGDNIDGSGAIAAGDGDVRMLDNGAVVAVSVGVGDVLASSEYTVSFDRSPSSS